MGEIGVSKESHLTSVILLVVIITTDNSSSIISSYTSSFQSPDSAGHKNRFRFEIYRHRTIPSSIAIGGSDPSCQRSVVRQRLP